MGAFGGLILTSRGRTLQVKAQAGTQLKYTRIAIGDGNLGGQSIFDLNALINERKSLSITKLKPLADNKATIGAVLNNQDMSSGFYFREIGVFAQDPEAGEILYCYGNAGNNAEYIPAGGAADLLEKHIDAVVIVGNAANVTAMIDQSLVLATKLELESHTHDGTPGNGPKISSTGLANAAVTDTILGNRTVDDTATPNTGPNTLTNLLSMIGNRLKNITGESNWSISPAMTIKQIFNKFLGSAVGGGHTHDGANGNGPKIAAGNISLVDSADYYAGTDPEAALAELGDKVIKQSPPTSVSLVSGQQVITSPRVAPYNVTSIKGLTRVNLLGRASFETSPYTGWNTYRSTITAQIGNTAPDTGIGRMSVTSTVDGYGAAYYVANYKGNKYYVFAAAIRNMTADSVRLVAGAAGASQIVNPPYLTDKLSEYRTMWARINVGPSDIAGGTVEFQVLGATGVNGVIDSARMYEITAAEYAALATMTEAQFNAKYPYVDDAKPITNPYVIKSGENLLPPFYEWETKPVNQIYAITDGGYTGTVTADGTTQQYTTTLPCIPGQAYTISGADIVPAGVAGVAYNIQWQDAAKNYISEFSSSNSNDGGNSIGTMVAPANAAYMTVRCVCRPAVSSGLFKFSRPMLNLGDTALPFKPREDDYLILPAKLHSNIDRSVYDEITYRDGKYFKNTRFKEFELDGSLPWVFGNNYSGYKFVSVPGSNIPGIILTTDENDPVTAIKYDGKILANHISFSTYGADCFNADGPTSNFALSLSDSDTGWGFSYVPTQAEIQAYFNGWRMCDPAGNTPYTSGTKAWARIDRFGTPQAEITTTLPTNKPTAPDYPKWTPYKLIYQLAAPTTEIIPVEGGITLHEGLNLLEVGAGMIVREKANPLLGGGGTTYNINNSNVIGSNLKYRTSRFISLYKNDKPDFWTQFPVASNSGTDLRISAGLFDNTAAYTVTYLPLDLHLLTGTVQTIEGEYSANLKTTVDTLAHSQADVLTRVSVLEAQKAGKEQPQLIIPTLLNGWTNYADSRYTPTAYYKDSLDTVRLQGLVSNGTISKAVFILPAGYRPTKMLKLPIATAAGYAELEIQTTGQVLVLSGSSTNWCSFDGISFRIA